MLSAPNPFSLIIFGASGHLAQLKLYPALYILALKKRLPKQYLIVGFSRTEMDEDAFKKIVADSIKRDLISVNKEVLKEFLSHVIYHQGQYAEPADYSELSNKLEKIEKGWEDNVRLAYFSVPPATYTDVAHNLCKGGIHTKDIPFRCIVEKPVGHDLASFQEIKDELIGCFQEEEIYLLDHYLGKESVRNIYYLRHANLILEQLLKNSLIHHVEIAALEPEGLEGRSGYFENTGAFRDMLQSHLLMIASLLTMKLRDKDDALLASRIDALKKLYIPPASNLDDVILQGQYTAGQVGKEKVSGYLEEEGINPDSRTNTFVALKLLSRAQGWEGVPFYLRSGKRLKEKKTRITIQFQQNTEAGKDALPNRLCIILQGEAGMRIHMQTKMGGTDPVFRPLVLEDPLVCVGDCLPEHSLLILEAIHGKHQWFLTFDGVQFAWRLLDPLQSHLDQKKTSLYLYKAGSDGPKEMDEWIEKDGIKWL
ncbi:glucose-6-phosphate dehydrogenase [Patescibacteria group bacterium]|nr:glucose-6-phosphate dehydrogenase [Patescibacteria group bacterium]